jgi:hypothetical protein
MRMTNGLPKTYYRTGDRREQKGGEIEQEINE